ncbi:MAG: bifunctional UDP-N-acetylglucosamine diphosphorylase/glucosamine-1-phosphate N-acetyltransferase GlmU [Clostridia bacterium]|nr:bifunctional UDP-N-acetylglucosamine diphosphorylase/glucosamine-1-phosphate N-acetyltransferase GlmU [Clostridia bacterium]
MVSVSNQNAGNFSEPIRSGSVCAIVLAAGEGKRMKSNKPKAMMEVLFKPMLGWVIDSVREAGIHDVCVVTGHLEEMIKEYLSKTYTGESVCSTVTQTERKGTGHAVMMAKGFLEAHKGGSVLILNGDAPFMDCRNISNSFFFHEAQSNCVTVISAMLDDPTGYGRILRAADGSLMSIVEHKEATMEQLAVKEVNSGAYWFSVDALLSVLDTDHIKQSSVTGEYYLPDAVKLLGDAANAFTADTASVVMGANDPVQLNELNQIARSAILNKMIADGVSLTCTDGVIIGPDVTIGSQTVILPGTILKGRVTIGSDCTIGPNTMIENSTIHDRVIINASQVKQSEIFEGTDIGPFSQIRPNCKIGPKVHIGDFVEVKNSVLDEGTKVAHLTYVGDSDVGKRVNFGCGCVTVNYDGQHKARCTVGDDCFIGCNTNLVAPVSIGAGAYTAAGSTITNDIPSDALGIARARQVVKDGWAAAKRSDKK